MRAAAIAAALGLVVAGCSSEERTAPVKSEGALVVALQSDGQTLDPHLANDAPSMRLIENLYCTLLRYGEGVSELRGDLALQHSVSEDGLTYSFELDPAARFYGSGRPVTADDVAWSIERIRRLGVRAQQFESVKALRTPGPHTLIIELKRPTAAFATFLAHPMNAVVDREVVEQNGDRLDHLAAGSGPFVLNQWRRNRHLVADANPAYHLGAPALPRLVLRPMPDETARMTALDTGEVQLVLDVPLREVERLESGPGIVLGRVPGTFWEYLGLNTRRPPLDDVRVRRAIAFALDRSELNALVKRGLATPLSGGHLPPNHWAHAAFEAYPEQDLARARTLLEEAGKPHPRLVLKVGSAFKEQVRAAQVVKQQLRKVGIEVTLEALESGIFFDALGRGDFDLSMVGWVGFVDPDEWTYELFHSQGQWNQQGYSNPEVDRLLEAGRREVRRDRRAQLYDRVQRILAREAPMAFVYLNPHLSAWREGLEGFVVHPTANTRSLRRARWAKER